MGLVATSKLRKCRRELNASNEYAKATKVNLESLASILDDDIEISYFSKNNSNKKLYIVVTSDSGLCAGYNNNVISYLNTIVNEKVEEDSLVMVIGSKGVNAIKRTGLNTIAEYVDIPDIPTIKEVKLIYERALALFNNKEVSEVNVIYTEFVSPIKQEVKIEKLLPIDKIEGEAGEVYVEPEIETVLKKSVDIYLKGVIRNLLLSARCSEQSSRMTAMNGATSNADDILNNLNLKFNRIRQTMITQEISEIVGGAEAQK